MHIERESEALAEAARGVRWWPAWIASILLGVAYALVSQRLTLGPSWALLVVVVLAAVGAQAVGRRGLGGATRAFALGSLVIATGAVSVSAVFLISALLNHSAEASALLRDAALLWTSNVLTFALWYWETDDGGPMRRHAKGHGSTDFAFPQTVLAGQSSSAWRPEFIDYLFLAFNTSTAFSPTDTLVMSHRAKLLMMYQSVISLLTIAVLAARAINTL